jgi:signal transduction histidine kinase
MARASLPDLILLDVMLPDLNGYEICGLLKADQRTRDIPVIFLSARGSVDAKVKAFTAGGVDYISKPLEEEEVFARVATHLNLRSAQNQLQARNRQLADEVEERQMTLALLRATIESTGEGIVVVDRNRRVIIHNQKLREMCCLPDGWSNNGVPIEVVPIPARLLKDQSCATKWAEDLYAHPEREDSSIVELKDDRIFELHSTPYRVGRVVAGRLWTVRDVTQRFSQERELRRHRDHLEELVDERTIELRKALESVEQQRERIRGLVARLTEVAEDERRRLARELHDQLGQGLSTIGINLNVVRKQIPDDDGVAWLFRVDDSLTLLEEMGERIANMMDDLRSPVLDDYGLVAAIRWYGAQFEKRMGIRVEVGGRELGRHLPEPVENALFRICQEALNNVGKHAHAKKVAISLEQLGDGRTRLVVADDGVGFDMKRSEKTSERSGWGLMIIAERAEAISGRSWIESAPGRGTRVIVEVGG